MLNNLFYTPFLAKRAQRSPSYFKSSAPEQNTLRDVGPGRAAKRRSSFHRTGSGREVRVRGCGGGVMPGAHPEINVLGAALVGTTIVFWYRFRACRCGRPLTTGYSAGGIARALTVTNANTRRRDGDEAPSRSRPNAHSAPLRTAVRRPNGGRLP